MEEGGEWGLDKAWWPRGVCGGLRGGERRANASESPYSCSILAGQLGEAGRNTEGRVIRRPSGWGWEEVRVAEGGKKGLSDSLVGHQPDVETIWRRWAGGRRARRRGQNAGRGGG